MEPHMSSVAASSRTNDTSGFRCLIVTCARDSIGLIMNEGGQHLSSLGVSRYRESVIREQRKIKFATICMSIARGTRMSRPLDGEWIK